MAKKDPTVLEMIEDFKQYVDHSINNGVNGTINGAIR